jgi:hypothetical protein
MYKEVVGLINATLADVKKKIEKQRVLEEQVGTRGLEQVQVCMKDGRTDVWTDGRTLDRRLFEED